MKEKPWIIYILECSDKTLYTGISQNPERRIEAHEQGRGARYTKGRGPLRLVYTEEQDTKSSALKREKAIKALRRKEKLKLIFESQKPLRSYFSSR